MNKGLRRFFKSEVFLWQNNNSRLVQTRRLSFLTRSYFRDVKRRDREGFDWCGGMASPGTPSGISGPSSKWPKRKRCTPKRVSSSKMNRRRISRRSKQNSCEAIPDEKASYRAKNNSQTFYSLSLLAQLVYIHGNNSVKASTLIYSRKKKMCIFKFYAKNKSGRLQERAKAPIKSSTQVTVRLSSI